MWPQVVPITSPEAQEQGPEPDKEVVALGYGPIRMGTGMSLNWFRCKWKTKCSKCGRELVEGDWAAYSREEDGQLVCKPCGKEEEEA
jgi:hypothetical protein